MTVRPRKPTDSLPQFVLVAGRSVAQEAVALRDAVDAFSTAPQPGCPHQSDWNAWPEASEPRTRARRELLTMMHHQSHLILVNAFDHITSLGRLLGSDGAMSVLSHLTASRVACEAAVRFAWIIDPGLRSEERIIRGAVCLLVSADEQLKGLRRVPTGRIPPQAMQQMIENCMRESTRVEQLITTAGIRLARSRDQKALARLELDSPAASVPIKFDVTEKMSELLPGVPSFYNISSGVVHSYYWMLRDVVSDRPTGTELTVEPDLMQIGAAAEAAVNASMLITSRCAEYYGHEPRSRLDQSRHRLEAVDQQMRLLGVINTAARLGSR